MAVKRNYRINLRNYGNPPAIMVSQYDENYDLVFEVYDGVVPATGLNAYTVKLVGRQPGEDPALKYEFTGTVSGMANNILSFTIDTTMTGRAGKGTAEIVIIDTTNDVKFASFNLPVYVEKAAVPDDAIDADVERAQEIADEVQDIVDTAAAEVKGEAEAWAVGQRDGVDVPSTDPAYENNAKFYAEQAAQTAEEISGVTDQVAQNTSDISDLKEDLNAELSQIRSATANLCNVSTGRYYIKSTGVISASSESYVGMAEAVSVKASTSYVIKFTDISTASSSRLYWSFYDANRNLIGAVEYISRAGTSTFNYTVTTTSESAFMCVCAYNGGGISAHAKIMITEGTDVPSEYIAPYTAHDKVARASIDTEVHDYLHQESAVSGYLTTTGSLHEDDATLCITTDYIEVTEGETYDLFVFNTSGPWTAVCFYNASKALVGERDTTYTTLKTLGSNRVLYKLITVPANVTYMRVTTRTYGGNIYYLVSNGAKGTLNGVITELMKGLYFGGGIAFTQQTYDGTDLDDFTKIGYVLSGYSTSYTNAPVSGSGYRVILTFEQGGVRMQWYINITRLHFYARQYASGAWKPWINLTPETETALYNESKNSVVYSPTYTQSDFASDLSDDVVRVMSYNVAQYDNDGAVHIGDSDKENILINFKKMLMHVGADIVCTQEDQTYIDSADTLTPLANLFAPLYPYKLGDGGPAMYYRKAGTVKNFALSSVTVRRGIVTVGNKSLYVYTAHLSVASSSKRQEQLQDIITNAIGVDNPTYWVLCGDFNTIEASDMSYLTTLASSNGYTLANGGYLGWLNTNKVALPLDNMMCGPNVVIKKFEVLGNWYNDLWSDHYPIYCDLILN